MELTATSNSNGAWSNVPADATYITGVAVSVSASKTGFAAPRCGAP